MDGQALWFVFERQVHYVVGNSPTTPSRDMFTPLFSVPSCWYLSSMISEPQESWDWMAEYGATVTSTPAMGQLLSAQATTAILFAPRVLLSEMS
ncbi:hypothetical protein JCM33374_g1366 [Metschnikowia sp. JCM 33374]|nr:hypothetical protein JCM33374_g1366 [Metschnikowia sp. JCM 33374]